MAQKKISKRELIDTGRDKRFVRRDEKGRFDEVVDVGRSLARDRRQHSKKVVPKMKLSSVADAAKELSRLRHISDRAGCFARLNSQTYVTLGNHADDLAFVIHDRHAPNLMFAHGFDCAGNIISAAARSDCSSHHVEDLGMVWISGFGDDLCRQIAIRNDPDQSPTSIIADHRN